MVWEAAIRLEVHWNKLKGRNPLRQPLRYNSTDSISRISDSFQGAKLFEFDEL